MLTNTLLTKFLAGDAMNASEREDVRGLINAPGSEVADIAGATAVTNIVIISQAAYDALPVKSPTTLYAIV